MKQENILGWIEVVLKLPGETLWTENFTSPTEPYPYDKDKRKCLKKKKRKKE